MGRLSYEIVFATSHGINDMIGTSSDFSP